MSETQLERDPLGPIFQEQCPRCNCVGATGQYRHYWEMPKTSRCPKCKTWMRWEIIDLRGWLNIVINGTIRSCCQTELYNRCRPTCPVVFANVCSLAVLVFVMLVVIWEVVT